jgi:quercetin dioxygenase-like cupin family protein
MGTRSSRILNTIALSLGLAAAAAAQTAVTMDQEPMHQLKFQNDFVRVFEMQVPAGATTQPHTHTYDGVQVRISNTQVTEAVTGGGSPSTRIKFGDVTYTELKGGPMTHTVTNTGQAPFRNIILEKLLPKKKSSGDLPPLSPTHEVLLNNSRVRVNKLTLQPGESSMLHTHSMPTLAVILQDGQVELATISGGGKTIAAKAGDAVWQNSGTTHIIRNVGTTPFEVVDIEIK